MITRWFEVHARDIDQNGRWRWCCLSETSNMDNAINEADNVSKQLNMDTRVIEINRAGNRIGTIYMSPPRE